MVEKKLFEGMSHFIVRLADEGYGIMQITRAVEDQYPVEYAANREKVNSETVAAHRLMSRLGSSPLDRPISELIRDSYRSAATGAQRRAAAGFMRLGMSFTGVKAEAVITQLMRHLNVPRYIAVDVFGIKYTGGSEDAAAERARLLIDQHRHDQDLIRDHPGIQCQYQSAVSALESVYGPSDPAAELGDKNACGWDRSRWSRVFDARSGSVSLGDAIVCEYRRSPPA